MNVQVSIPRERAKSVRALIEAKRMKYVDYKTANIQRALATNPNGEFVHVLIDYRDENKHIVRKAMTRKSAYDLNKRLEGTGLGWALASL